MAVLPTTTKKKVKAKDSEFPLYCKCSLLTLVVYVADQEETPEAIAGGVKISLQFKRFIFDPDKKMIQ